MKVNLEVRWKNPVFWAQVVAAIVLPLIVGVGFEWKDMTSWPALGNAIIAGLQNPVVFVTMVVSLWTAITDPTTSGVSDSALVLERDRPGKNYKGGKNER